MQLDRDGPLGSSYKAAVNFMGFVLHQPGSGLSHYYGNRRLYVRLRAELPC